MINCKQCAIQRYVEDNKVTHAIEDGITGVIDITKKHFGELVVSFRKKHTSLGIDIKLVQDGKIIIGIQSYIKEPIKTF